MRFQQSFFATNFIEIALRHWCSLVNFLWVNTSGWLLLQVALFGFISELDNLDIVQNLTLLIFKLYAYKSRKSGVLKMNSLIKLNKKRHETWKTRKENCFCM